MRINLCHLNGQALNSHAVEEKLTKVTECFVGRRGVIPLSYLHKHSFAHGTNLHHNIYAHITRASLSLREEVSEKKMYNDLTVIVQDACVFISFFCFKLCIVFAVFCSVFYGFTDSIFKNNV